MHSDIHILLVEDNDGDILLTREALDGNGIGHLSVVKDGEAAIRFLEGEAPYETERSVSMVLLDINLPKVDGIEVLDHIKNSDRLRAIPVIMLTTSSAPDDIQKSYYKHANSYITKPGDLEEFTRQLRLIEDYWISTAQLPPACS